MTGEWGNAGEPGTTCTLTACISRETRQKSRILPAAAHIATEALQEVTCTSSSCSTLKSPPM
eukprot:2297270-Pyramimonas_sp.AAC.1